MNKEWPVILSKRHSHGFNGLIYSGHLSSFILRRYGYMEYQLNGENFLLIINPKVFEEDIRLPSNTALEVIVQSNGFSAHTAMDIDIKEFAKFALDLNHIYETLSGEARIEEPYGVRMYISFIGNGRGHIAVKGFLHREDGAGNEQRLEFENEVDQTCLKNFSCALLRDCKKYL